MIRNSMNEKILGLGLGKGELYGVIIRKNRKNIAVIESCCIPYHHPAASSDNPSLEHGDPYSSGNSQHLKDRNVNDRNIKVGDESSENAGTGASGSSGKDGEKQLFTNALHQVLSELDVAECTSSAVTLSAKMVSFRTLDLPFTSTSKVRQVLDFELSSHLPLAHGNYLTDFTILNKIPLKSRAATGHSTTGAPVMTASVPVELVDLCFTALKQKGLQPNVITSDGVAAATLVMAGNVVKEDSFILLEVDCHTTTLTFIHKNTIVAIRSFIGAQEAAFLDRAIQQTLTGIGMRHGIEISLHQCYLLSAMPPEWKLELPGRSIKELNLSDFVTGGKSGQAGDFVTIFPSPGLATPPLRAAAPSSSNPENSPSLSHISSMSEMSENRWFSAVAAAVTSVEGGPLVNFCRGIYARDSFFQKFRKSILLLSCFMVLCFFSLIFNIHYESVLLQKQLNNLDAAVTELFEQTFPQVTTIVEPLMQMKVKVKEAETEYALKPGRNGNSAALSVRAVDILYELSSRIPHKVDVEITRLLFSDERVVIAGTTDNFNSVDQMKTRLERSPKFKTVTINSATAEKKGNKVKFNFIIEL